MMSFEDMVRQIKEEKDNPPIQVGFRVHLRGEGLSTTEGFLGS